MSGPFEKYVAQAAQALDPTAFDPAQPNHDGPIRQFRRDRAAGQARAVLATVGPLIEEDTRDRMVTAAGRALERDGGGEQAIRAEAELGCESTHPEASHIPCKKRPGHTGDHVSRRGRNWRES